MVGKTLEFRASASSRWFNCPGSLHLQIHIPEAEPRVYAAEGTVAHKLAEVFLTHWTTKLNKDMLSDTLFAKQFLSFREEHQNKTIEEAGFQIEITPEMLDAVNVYATYIRDILIREGCTWAELQTELTVDIIKKHNFSGTIDAFFVGKNPFRKVAHVFDLKYGKGIPVDSAGNTQLQCYCVGTLANKYEIIETHICQPRITYRKPTNSTTYAVGEIKKFKTLISKKIKAVVEKPEVYAAGTWCQFCPAKANCPLTKKALSKPETLELDPKNPQEYKVLWEKVVSFEKLIKSTKEKIMEYVKDGGVIEGYKLVPGRPTRRWVNVNKAEAQLKEKYGDEIYTTKELKSPAQMEKVSEVDKKDILDLCASVASTVVLKKTDDTDDAIQDLMGALK